MKKLFWLTTLCVTLVACGPSPEQIIPTISMGPPTPIPPPSAESVNFNFTRQLFGTPSTVSLWVEEINTATGEVAVNGVDYRQPATPFTFDWGEGTTNDGGFPQRHIYLDLTRNYVVKVIANYPGAEMDSAEIVVRFVPPKITPVALPPGMAVTIPDHDVTLSSRMYSVPESLTCFDDSVFSFVPRSTVEYILTVASWIQYDFANGDVFLTDGRFEQVVLRDPTFDEGMYSLWYTSPASFGVGDYGFQGIIQYSSFFHEMGHNYTLNSPANYYYGGKTDGNANAIFSETMANIFAHATAYEIVNNYETYGISDDLAVDLKQSANSSIKVVRNAYESYLSSGMNFCSWNDPTTPEDETFNTFMTIVHQFCAHAEEAGQGYRTSVKRMMHFLQLFDEDLSRRYDQHNDAPEADTFRATFMVTALSYAFSIDLRTEFRDLNFPISDEVYKELYSLVNPIRSATLGNF